MVLKKFKKEHRHFVSSSNIRFNLLFFLSILMIIYRIYCIFDDTIYDSRDKEYSDKMNVDVEKDRLTKIFLNMKYNFWIDIFCAIMVFVILYFHRKIIHHMQISKANTVKTILKVSISLNFGWLMIVIYIYGLTEPSIMFISS